MWRRLLPTPESDPGLYPFRSGLVFGFFNALTWQVALGTPLVIFAEELGASPTEVGLGASFILLLTPLQIVATMLLHPFGYKAVMLAGWGVRGIFVGVPFILACVAPWTAPAPWMVTMLLASLFCFCFCRSIGAASFQPWIYSLMDKNTAGRYFASDQYILAMGSVATLVYCVVSFHFLPVYAALAMQYGVAMLGSYLAWKALSEMPDGQRPAQVTLRHVFLDTPRHIFSPGAFRRCLWLSVIFNLIATPIPPFVDYYLKAELVVPPAQIMVCEVVRYCGVFVAGFALRRRLERHGGKTYLAVGAALVAVVALFWLTYVHLQARSMWWVAGGNFVMGMAATTWLVANLHYLPTQVPETERPLMVSIHTAVTQCMGGIAPVVWGSLLGGKDDSGAKMSVNRLEDLFLGTAAVALVLVALVPLLKPEPRKHEAEAVSGLEAE